MLPSSTSDIGTDARVGFESLVHLIDARANSFGNNCCHLFRIFTIEVFDPIVPGKLGVRCLSGRIKMI